MQAAVRGKDRLEPRTADFYRQALAILTTSKVPFLVGGAYALERYTGIQRHTKDLDVFVHAGDCRRVLDVFSETGYRGELTFPHWLGKVFGPNGDFIDVIFSSGNGIARVDAAWFEHAIDAEVLGVPVKLSPPEEMIWSKSFVMERERYDGADVIHLLRALGRRLDWSRLLYRFDADWRVLLQYLILFGYIYPGEQAQIPDQVMHPLLSRLQGELATPPPAERVCRGTLLSREQYLTDVEEWGYQDARVARATLTPEDLRLWTEAIDQ